MKPMIKDDKEKTPRGNAANSTKPAGKRGEQKATKAAGTPPPKKPKKQKKAVKQIYSTTDGFLGNKPQIKKPRKVAAIEQRPSDGAVALVKISSKDGKEAKIGKDFIPNLELTPAAHTSLTKTSIVSRQVIFGIKDGDTFKPIHIRDLSETGDKLTRKELRKIRKEVQNYKKQHRKTYKKKRRKWFKRKFKQ